MSFRSEHIEQAEFVSWFRKTYPGTIIFAIPNGGARSKSQGARLRLQGVLAGVFDLMVPEWHLWIEMKRQDGRLSPAQTAFGKAMLEAGYQCMVAYGCDDAIEQILNGPRDSWDRPSRRTAHSDRRTVV